MTQTAAPVEVTREQVEAWLVEHSHVFSCGMCGRAWLTSRTTAILWHECRGYKPTKTKPTRDRDVDRQDWARGILGDELEKQVLERDATALLRRLDDE